MGKKIRRMNANPEACMVSIDWAGVSRWACACASSRDESALRMLRDFCEMGMDPNRFGPSARSPAMVAAAYGNAEALELLGEMGADFELKGRGGRSVKDIVKDGAIRGWGYRGSDDMPRLEAIVEKWLLARHAASDAKKAETVRL